MSETQETRVQSPGQEDPLEKGIATHSSIPTWRIPGTEEPGGLQLLWSQRIRHDWATERACNQLKDGLGQRNLTVRSSHSSKMVQNQWFIISGIAGENCQKILEGKQVLLGTHMGSPRVCKWNVFWLQMWYMCLFKVSLGRLSDS